MNGWNHGIDQIEMSNKFCISNELYSTIYIKPLSSLILSLVNSNTDQEAFLKP